MNRRSPVCSRVLATSVLAARWGGPIRSQAARSRSSTTGCSPRWCSTWRRSPAWPDRCAMRSPLHGMRALSRCRGTVRAIAKPASRLPRSGSLDAADSALRHDATRKRQLQVVVGDDARCGGDDGRDRVDRWHRGDDVAEPHEVGHCLGLLDEVRWWQEADLHCDRWQPVDGDLPGVPFDLPVWIERLALAPPDIQVDDGLAADASLPAG